MASPDKIDWGGQVCKGVWGHALQKKYSQNTLLRSWQNVGNALSAKKLFHIAMLRHLMLHFLYHCQQDSEYLLNPPPPTLLNGLTSIGKSTSGKTGVDTSPWQRHWILLKYNINDSRVSLWKTANCNFTLEYCKRMAVEMLYRIYERLGFCHTRLSHA